MIITPTVEKIKVKFKRYYKHIRDTLESFHLIEFYIPHLHNLLKDNGIPLLRIYNPTSWLEEPLNKKIHLVQLIS